MDNQINHTYGIDSYEEVQQDFLRTAIQYSLVVKTKNLSIKKTEHSLGLHKSDIIRILAKSGILVSSRGSTILKEKELEIIVKAYSAAVRKAVEKFKTSRHSFVQAKRSEFEGFLTLLSSYSITSEDNQTFDPNNTEIPSTLQIEYAVWQLIRSVNNHEGLKQFIYSEFKKIYGLPKCKLTSKPNFLTTCCETLSHNYHVFPNDEENAKTNASVFALHALNRLNK